MIVFSDYSVPYILGLAEVLPRADLYGYRVRLQSPRLELLRIKGTVCVNCGLEGVFFRLETANANMTPHLNLYGVNSDGKPILFTKDHIIPKSKGGANELENYQTMCSPCNEKKGNTL